MWSASRIFMGKLCCIMPADVFAEHSPVEAMLIVFRPSLRRIAQFFVADEVLASDTYAGEESSRTPVCDQTIADTEDQRPYGNLRAARFAPVEFGC